MGKGLGGGRRGATLRGPAAVLLATVVAVATPVVADEETLGEVVVTAPPESEGRPPESPTAFGTVIETSTAPTRVETLAEALAESVGVQVRRFGGLGDFSTVSIRGAASGQVQVYLDGVPLSRADNEVVNLAELPLDAVERVDVYRGTTPLAFAQAAPGGVVNVITRRPSQRPLTAASASYGSFDTRKVDLVRSARLTGWEYLAFAHYLGSAGDFSFTNDLGTTANPADDRRERRRNNGFDLGDVAVRAGYRPGGPFAATLTSETFLKDEGVPGVGSVQAERTSLRTLRQLAHLDLDYATGGRLPVDAGGQAYVVYEDQVFDDRRGEIALAPEHTESVTTATGAQTVVRAAVGRHHVLGLLVAAGHERFAQEDRLQPDASMPDRTRLRGTVAGEDEILALGERISLVPGLRWEIFRDDFPGTSGVPASLRGGGVRVRDFFSPRVGLRAGAWWGITLLGNIGRYGRQPNLAELFGNRGVVLGNPRLRPEVAVNSDVGFRAGPRAWKGLTRLALEYAYFDNTVDDLIVLVQNSQGVARYQNVTAATVRGHEIAARGRLAERLGVTLNYTHQDARDDGPVPFLRGKHLPGRPSDEAFARLELSWSRERPLPLGSWARRLWPGRLFYEVNIIAGNFLDRANVREVKSRTLHDVGLEVGLPLPGVRVTVEAKNAGDDETRDALGFPLPGRALFVTVSYGFGREDDVAQTDAPSGPAGPAPPASTPPRP